MALDPICQRRKAVRIGTVIDVAPVTTFAHEPGALQRGQMLGNRGLRDVETGLDLRHAHLPIRQALEYGAASRVGQGTEDGRFLHDYNISVRLYVAQAVLLVAQRLDGFGACDDERVSGYCSQRDEERKDAGSYEHHRVLVYVVGKPLEPASHEEVGERPREEVGPQHR